MGGGSIPHKMKTNEQNSKIPLYKKTALRFWIKNSVKSAKEIKILSSKKQKSTCKYFKRNIHSMLHFLKYECSWLWCWCRHSKMCVDVSLSPHSLLLSLLTIMTAYAVYVNLHFTHFYSSFLICFFFCLYLHTILPTTFYIWHPKKIFPNEKNHSEKAENVKKICAR